MYFIILTWYKTTDTYTYLYRPRRHLEIKVYAHSRAHKGSEVGFRSSSGLSALYTSHFYNQEAINLTFNLHK